jgi:hypothetical protein
MSHTATQINALACILPHTAACIDTHCRTLPHTAVHTAAYCRTTAHCNMHYHTICSTAALPHIAARTVTHCHTCAQCRVHIATHCHTHYHTHMFWYLDGKSAKMWGSVAPYPLLQHSHLYMACVMTAGLLPARKMTLKPEEACKLRSGSINKCDLLVAH